jgi:hypothetical protein
VLGLVFGSLLRYALREDLTSLAPPVGLLTGFLVLAVVVGCWAPPCRPSGRRGWML